MLNMKPTFIVVVKYKGLDSAKDMKLIRLAKRFRGSFDGTGFCFTSGRREVILEFKDKNDAKDFLSLVREKLNVTGRWHKADVV